MKKSYIKSLREYAGITLGALITALALDFFLIPNKIAAGGVSGIAIIIYHLVGFPVGIGKLLINIPLFIGGFKGLGLNFIIRSLYGTIVLSFFIDFLAPFLKSPTEDPLLACLFGGVLTGLGLGLVFRNKGTTGGTDLVAALFRRYLGMNVGQALFIIDGLVIIAAGIVFSPELALYALITVFVTSWIIDLVQEGFNYAKAVMIISGKTDLIAKKIISELDRGGTSLTGRGIYTGKDKNVLISVVGRAEVSKLKELIHNIDPDAFVILHNVHEVLGEGFKQYS